MKPSYRQDRVLGILEVYVRKGAAALLIVAGVTLLTIGAGFDFTIEFFRATVDGDVVSGVLGTADVPVWQRVLAAIVGVILIAFGAFLVLAKHMEATRKKVTVIEIRGLQDTIDSPLIDAIPTRISGRKSERSYDLRGLINGTNDQLEKALAQINSLPRDIEREKNGLDRKDLSICVGSLASVPFQFLAGTLLTSESKIHWFEWDRTAKRWVQPELCHDTIELNDIDYSSITGAEEVVLAGPLSYPILASAFENSFPGLPVVRFEAENPKPGLLLSEDALVCLEQRFSDCLVRLQGMGVQKVHLAIASSGIVSLRMGSIFSPRNMPRMVVYQYQKDDPINSYPWGIEMPDSECSKGKLRRNEYSNEVTR